MSRWRIWIRTDEGWYSPIHNPDGSHRSFDSEAASQTVVEELREGPWLGELVVAPEGTYPELDDQGNSTSLRLLADTGAGDWIVQAARERDLFFAVVAPGFADYVRVFHPAWRYERVDRLDFHTLVSHEVRWSEVAAANGRVAHPEMDWESITGYWHSEIGSGGQPDLWDAVPEEGSLAEPQLRALARVLAPHTATANSCFFGIWEGYGDVRAQWPDAPTLPMPPDRDMVLLAGPLSAATTSFVFREFFSRSPSLWWPEDHAWCVGTDVDLTSTYIGGSPACIEAVLADPSLEAMRVTADYTLLGGPDRINPEP